MLFFAPKGTLSCFGSDKVPSRKQRGSLFTLSYKLHVNGKTMFIVRKGRKHSAANEGMENSYRLPRL